MRWHLGASADATTLVRTHSYVQGTVGRKLPAGISSDDKSLTREREISLAKGGVTPHLGLRETKMPSAVLPEGAKDSHGTQRAVFGN